jgi:hypothetical protein
MALTKLKIYSPNGNYELSEYVMTQKGEGLDVAGPQFSNKVMAHSVLKVGGVLALEDLKEKEQIYPLRLHAASKRAVNEIVEEVGTLINTPGSQVEWQDFGESESTFWDIISGQIDIEENYWENAQNWLVGKLRLFVQPLGYFTRAGARAVGVSGVATTVRVGTSPVIVFPASGSIRGDGPALLQGQLVSEGVASSACYAMSVLPSNEYIPFIPAASGAKFQSSFATEANAPGGTYAHWVGIGGGTEIYEFSTASSKYSYVGENRILVAARTPAGATPICLRTVYQGFFSEAATIAATTAWRLYDLGVINVASSYLNTGEKHKLQLRYAVTVGPSTAIDIGGMIQLPDKTTTFLNTGTYAASANLNYASFDGVANTVNIGGNLGVSASGIEKSVASTGTANISELTGYSRGAIPPVPASNEPISVAFLVAGIVGGSMNKKTLVNVNVLERCRYMF